MKLNFKKNKNIYAPVNGVTYPIDKVNDDTFNQKMLGPGFAICSYDPLLVSPVDGIIRVVTKTKHAVMIESNGVEILIHVGIDTCLLNGDGFELLVEVNQKVKVGDPMLKINHLLFQEKGINSDVIVVFTNLSENKLTIKTEQEVYKTKSIIATVL